MNKLWAKTPRDAFVFLKDLLSSFTSILDTIHEIKTHVLEAVEEEVHDIVFNTLMFESHEALIELSSQTVVDVVSVESYSIDRIEPSLVIFKGYGDVECTLNYGSKRDPFSTGHSVPFTFKLCSPVNDVTKIEFYEQEWIWTIVRSTNSNLTICSRGIRNAWHFHYALVLVFKVVCGGIGIALLTP